MSNSTPTVTTDRDGTIRWHLEGELHREDGPAVEYANGIKEWYLNGKKHRADGPAMEHCDGRKKWYVKGGRISASYSQVLTAAFDRGLPISPELLADVLKAMPKTQNAQDDQRTQLNSILHKYWPMHVTKILATLFSDSDPTMKHLAFSLLGRESRSERSKGSVGL